MATLRTSSQSFWLPGLGGARGPASTLQRLQTEAQMLLYTHPASTTISVVKLLRMMNSTEMPSTPKA